MDTNVVREDQDEEYARNRERNVDDAIALLPRLATGIDMNPMFRRIDDFGFTAELAVFDHLDIPLYHGWIVDPKLVVWEKKREFRSSKGVVWHMEEDNWKQEDHCYMGFRIGSKKDTVGSKSYNALVAGIAEFRSVT